MDASPKTLQQAMRQFDDEQTCIDTVAKMRWPKGIPVCPACEHKDHYYLKTQKRWKCKECSKQFSVKLGTIFEDSPITLDKWLAALWMLVNNANGISSYEIASAFGISQKAAWFMLHRLRLALQTGNVKKLGGGGNEVEADETYIGGKAKNMHQSRKIKLLKIKNEIPTRKLVGTNPGSMPGKTPVAGVLDRETRKVRVTVMPNIKRETLQNHILKHVEHGSHLYTDSAIAYDKLSENYTHEIVNHLTTYVDGRIHTNGIENFWSLLKRSLHGTYVAVEPFHLFRYVDEQAFRFNNRKDETGRKLTASERFNIALSQVAGKRLTFKEVTGKVGETAF